MKTLVGFALVMFMVSISFAQWDTGESFPDPNENTVEGYGHGIAVDGNGRIWYSSYYSMDSIYVPAPVDSFVACRGIKVFNPDGTLETTVKTFGPLDPSESYFGYEVDTFWYSLRGLGTTPDGDVIVSVYDSWYVVDKDDFTTKMIVKQPFGENSITKVATDARGNFYVTMVIAGGNPIKVFDPSGNFIRDVVPGDLTSGYSRTIEVSPDANDIYFFSYTSSGVVIFHSDEGLNGDYTSQIDTIYGLNVESAGWDPFGRLWMGVHPNSDDRFPQYGHVAWDPIQRAIVDSIIPDPSIIDDNYLLPRGIAFSPDGQKAYLTYFGSWDVNGIYVHSYLGDPIYPIPSEPNWTLLINASTDKFSNSIEVGTRSYATDNFDETFDIPAAPVPVSDYFRAIIYNPEWAIFSEYIKDFKAPFSFIEDEKHWNIRIQTDHYNQSAELSFIFLQNASYNIGVYLKDLSTQEVFRINEDYFTHPFTTSNEGFNDFVLMIGAIGLEEVSYFPKPGWTLLSLPVKTRLETEPFQVSLNDQIYYIYSYVNNSYTEPKLIEMGKGYWLGLLEDSHITYKGEEILDTLSINLSSGGNLLGNPFLYTISKNNIRIKSGSSSLSYNEAVSNGIIADALYSFDNSSASYLVSETLEPWTGFWLYTLSSDLELDFIPGEASKSTESPSTLTDLEWKISFNVESDWARDHLCALGEFEDASKDYDPKYDYPRPPYPPSGKFVNAFFHNENWSILGPEYVRDIRTTSQEDDTWKLHIISSDSGTVKLYWELENIDIFHSTNIHLLCEALEINVDMKQANHIQFNYTEPIVFEIQKDVIPIAIEENQIPDKYVLNKNYPNPFNPTTRIQFGLPEPSSVKLMIYDVTGRMIKNWQFESQSSGWHEIIWNGTNSYGQQVSTGVYIYQLQAGDFMQSRKMVFMK